MTDRGALYLSLLRRVSPPEEGPPRAGCDRCGQSSTSLIMLEWRGGWLAHDPIPMKYCLGCYQDAKTWAGENLLGESSVSHQ
jgi:hypothetical protein